MKALGNADETAFNVWLASALGKVDPRHEEGFNPERNESRVGGRKKPDIRVSSSPKVVIECAYGGDRGKDALDKMAHGDETVFAVNIPKEYKRMVEKEAREAMEAGNPPLGYAVHQPGFRFPEKGYIEGNVRDFAEFVRAGSVSMDAVKQATSEVEGKIAAGRRILEKPLKGIQKKIETLVHQRTPLTALNTSLLLWLDAMLVQEHLANRDRRKAPPVPVEKKDIKLSYFVDAWREILKDNWHAVFKPAVDALVAAAEADRVETVRALEKVVEAVDCMRHRRLGDIVNIGAELFPSLSADRKEAAAFYTTPATGEMLAVMTIRENDRPDWADAGKFAKHQGANRQPGLKVADLACGTGTLLRAAYCRIRFLIESSTGEVCKKGRLHRDAMEGGLVGGDISPIAAHLCNSSLTVLGDGEKYGKTQIGYVGVGETQGYKRGKSGSKSGNPEVATGTLEFLKKEVVNDLFDDRGGVADGLKGDAGSIAVYDKDFDYILMNPPYSRTRGGQSAFDIAGLSKEERDLCQKLWGRQINGLAAIKTAGMAASFLCLAAQKIKPGGRIGFVLPNTAAFAESWSVTREMLVKEFKDIIAVSKGGQSGGKDKDAHSADTGMGEMLLCATRREAEDARRGPSKVVCATLRRIPTRLGEAGVVGKMIEAEARHLESGQAPICVGEEEIGVLFAYEPLGDEPWMPLGALNPHIAHSALQIARKGVLEDAEGGEAMKFNVPMTTASRLFEIGTTHHYIGCIPYSRFPSGAYVWTPITRKADAVAGILSLWMAEMGKQRQMEVVPTHKGSLRDEDMAKQISALRGHLHYARNMRWTSQSLLVAETQSKVFGGRAWASLLHQDRRVEKAFALWANSILGLVAHWTQGQRTQKGRASTQVKALRVIPCPNLAELPESLLDAAAQAFDEMRKAPLKPACQAHMDDNRKRIDAACAKMLRLPKKRAAKAMDALRRQWCAEPTVHGENKAALEALEKAELL